MLMETAPNSGYFFVIDTNPENSHLGGNIKGGDPWCRSPELWDYLIEKYKVKSLLDVGSGDGSTTKYFMDKGIECLGIEGLQENVDASLCPVVHLDLTKGKYKSEKMFDMTYSMETGEHIPKEHIDNFIETLCNSRIIALSCAQPSQLGHNHVTLKHSCFWINLLEAKGYKFLAEDTTIARNIDKTSYFRTSGLIFQKIAKKDLFAGFGTASDVFILH